MTVIYEKYGIRKALKDLLSSPTLDYAVAFWGRGAKKELFTNTDGTKFGGKVRIICDLDSGACDLNEMSKFFETPGQFTIRNLSGMHAKVYIGDATAVIGSANASPNGLGIAGNMTAGNYDAVVQITNREDVGDCQKWFNDLWDKECKQEDVEKKDLKKYGKFWRQRQRVLSQKNREFYDAFVANPDEFKGKRLFVFAYSDSKDLPKDGKRDLKEKNKERMANGEVQFKGGYYDWNSSLKKEDYGIDIWIDKTDDKKSKPNGLWEIGGFSGKTACAEKKGRWGPYTFDNKKSGKKFLVLIQKYKKKKPLQFDKPIPLEVLIPFLKER